MYLNLLQKFIVALCCVATVLGQPLPSFGLAPSSHWQGASATNEPDADEPALSKSDEAIVKKAVGKIFLFASQGLLDPMHPLQPAHRAAVEEVLRARGRDIVLGNEPLEVLFDKANSQWVALGVVWIRGRLYQWKAVEAGWDVPPQLGVKRIHPRKSEDSPASAYRIVEIVRVPPEAKIGTELPIPPGTSVVPLDRGSYLYSFRMVEGVLKIPSLCTGVDEEFLPPSVDIQKDILDGHLLAKRKLGGFGMGTTIVRHLEIPARYFSLSDEKLGKMQAYRRGDTIVIPWAVYQDTIGSKLFDEIKRLYAKTIMKVDKSRLSAEVLALPGISSKSSDRNTKVSIPIFGYVVRCVSGWEIICKGLEDADRAGFYRARNAALRIAHLLRNFLILNTNMLAHGILNLDMDIKNYGIVEFSEDVALFDYTHVADHLDGDRDVRKRERERSSHVKDPIDHFFYDWNLKNRNALWNIAPEIADFFHWENRDRDGDAMRKWWGLATADVRPLSDAASEERRLRRRVHDFQNLLEQGYSLDRIPATLIREIEGLEQALGLKNTKDYFTVDFYGRRYAMHPYAKSIVAKVEPENISAALAQLST